jgi:hypothetical protein
MAYLRLGQVQGISTSVYKYYTDPKVRVQVQVCIPVLVLCIVLEYKYQVQLGSECCYLMSTSSTMKNIVSCHLWNQIYRPLANQCNLVLSDVIRVNQLPGYFSPRIIFLLLFTPTQKNMNVPEFSESTWICNWILSTLDLYLSTSTDTWEFRSLYLSTSTCTQENDLSTSTSTWIRPQP